MTHYEVLGVPRSATAEEIRAAYLRAAATAHPDKGGTKERFQQVQQAYATLSKPEDRERYDLTLDLAPAQAAGARVAEHALKEAESIGVDLVRALGAYARRRLGIRR